MFDIEDGVIVSVLTKYGCEHHSQISFGLVRPKGIALDV